jgi:hypothetical protein
MLNNDFEEVLAWFTYQHENGLTVSCDERGWSIDHESKGWTEIGSFNNIDLNINL